MISIYIYISAYIIHMHFMFSICQLLSALQVYSRMFKNMKFGGKRM